MKNFILMFLFFIFANLICFAGNANSQTMQGNAVRWLDADTIDFRARSGKYYRVRFRGIDSPELRQTQGKECRDLLMDETKSITLFFESSERDRYSRFVGKLWTDSIPDLSLWLIENGCAWEYSAPLSVKTSYQNAEQIAREDELGLWAEVCPTPPWMFRASGYLRAGECE